MVVQQIPQRHPNPSTSRSTTVRRVGGSCIRPRRATRQRSLVSSASRFTYRHHTDSPRNRRQNASSKYYDYRLIYERLQAIIDARDEDDILTLVNLLRSGLVRNLGNITTPRLFNRAYAGTKLLIEDYITQVALAIEYVTAYPTEPVNEQFVGGLTSQAKLDLLHDTRQAFGRSALVLQGGAIFGLCHIGVVKALHLRGLLPRIIAGTATGALIAALVGVHTEDELSEFLTGDRIDLSAFEARTRTSTWEKNEQTEGLGWLSTLIRRTRRFFREGYFLDVKMLEACVRDNVGEMTFEESYQKTKRVLNITISTNREGGIPSLLNYLTAPNILIWSAAVASNTSHGPLFSPVTLLCKDLSGQIHPWSTTAPNSPASLRSALVQPLTKIMPSRTPRDVRESPLSRVAELFNVNHFVVSQARPYVAPFLQSGDILSQAQPRHSTTRRRGYIWTPIIRICALEIQHRLRQLDTLGLLHNRIRRFLIDETVPGASLTLAPELSGGDFLRLLERPTKSTVDEWILRGERSAWPAIGALKVRCAVEVELDRGYQYVRRRKPMDAVEAAESRRRSQSVGSPTHGVDGTNGAHDVNGAKGANGVDGLRGSGEKRKRIRSGSAGAGRSGRVNP